MPKKRRRVLQPHEIKPTQLQKNLGARSTTAALLINSLNAAGHAASASALSNPQNILRSTIANLEQNKANINAPRTNEKGLRCSVDLGSVNHPMIPIKQRGESLYKRGNNFHNNFEK